MFKIVFNNVNCPFIIIMWDFVAVIWSCVQVLVANPDAETLTVISIRVEARVEVLVPGIIAPACS